MDYFSIFENAYCGALFLYYTTENELIRELLIITLNFVSMFPYFPFCLNNDKINKNSDVALFMKKS